MAINRSNSPKQLVGGQKKLDVDKDATARMATGGRVMLKPLMRNRG